MLLKTIFFFYLKENIHLLLGYFFRLKNNHNLLDLLFLQFLNIFFQNFEYISYLF